MASEQGTRGGWTAGPWRVDTNGYHIESGTKTVAGVFGSQSRGEADRSECAANARLIALAPEMAEALRRADAVFRAVADDAGDVALWNKGGDGYDTWTVVGTLLARLDTVKP